MDPDDQTDDIDVSTFENVTGSMHDDTITGDYRFNVLNGMGGDDTLRAAAVSTTSLVGLARTFSTVESRSDPG